MKKFNKKAIFAALMGALSSVSSFATGRSFDDTQLYKSKIQEHCRFLDVGDYYLNSSTHRKKLDEIFRQIATIEYENFDGTLNKPLNSGIITSRWRREKNLKVFRDENRIPKAYEWRVHIGGKPPKREKENLKKEKQENSKSDNQNPKVVRPWAGSKTPTLNPGLDLEDKFARNRRIYTTAEKYKTEFLKNETCFLIHTDLLGNVDGFVKFNVQGENNIFVGRLATKGLKIRSGIGGALIKTLQKKYERIELSSKDKNSDGFYEHLGFKETDENGKMYNNGHMVWSNI